MNHYRYALAVCGLLMLLSGCASTMRAKVELIEPAKGYTDQDAAPGGPSLLQAVQDTVGALEVFTRGVDEMNRQYPADMRQTFGDILSCRDRCQSAIQQGNDLVGRAKRVSDPDERAVLAVEMRGYVSNIAGEAQQADQMRRVSLAEEKLEYLNLPADAKQAFKESLSAYTSTFQTTMFRAKESSTQTIGFGGLQYCGTDVLCPGDPRYRMVVQGRSIGVISNASTQALGDSTIVFFQETPTQMKNFSADLDAAQMLQNVALIMDKAVTAFSKYLSVGAGFPTP